ncbi:LysR substrate-binding domain-containing protein [Klebsiella variicola subsp. variicola]|nr:LysR substrate-binding domain-containing protein [Klebsiella variicola subsp. variicola]
MAPSTASVLGVPFINAMRESYPDVRLHLVESLSGNLERMINTRQLDLAIVFQQEKILRWSARPVLEERLFLIGTHALLAPCRRTTSPPDQLTSLPLIMPSQGHGLRAAGWRRFASSIISALRVVADIDGLALLMQAVRSGLGGHPAARGRHLPTSTIRR